MFSCGLYKKNLLTILVLCLFISPSFAKYSGGTGTSTDPYLISTPQDMNAIGADSNDWNKYFKMIADINLADFTGMKFKIIGSSAKPFTGSFNGNKHIIRNFTFHDLTASVREVGLFGSVSSKTLQPAIYDLGLVEPNVICWRGGILIGILSRGTVERCFVRDGSVKGVGTAPQNSIGGLIGIVYSGNVKDSYSTVTVKANGVCGGLVGAYGSYGRSSGELVNCYAAGFVEGPSQYSGGLVGITLSGEYAAIVSKSSFWDIETSCQNTSRAGEGKTTVQMKSMQTFLAWGCSSGVWKIDESLDYPRLSWENSPGTLIETPGDFSGGSGSKEDPYLIYTAVQLNSIGQIPCLVDKHFRLMADIDLSDLGGTKFNCIGSSMFPFTGTFDGNGKSILNFNFEATEKTDYVGLFGYVKGAAAVIQNIKLINPQIAVSQGTGAGALIGYVTDANVYDCFVEAGFVTGDKNVGGLIGESYSSDSVYGKPSALILNCQTDIIVHGNENVGGLIGFNCGDVFDSSAAGPVSGSTCGGFVGELDGPASDIGRCFAAGNVNGNSNVGGFVGFNGSSDIINCYARGNVTGVSKVGGFCGYSAMDALGYTPHIEKSYSTGKVTGTNYCGAFIGWNYEHETPTYVDHCFLVRNFWDATVNQSLPGAGLGDIGSTYGKTTAELYQRKTFTDVYWDFNNIWRICDGTNYPKLQWAPILTGDFTCPDGVDFIDYSILAKQWMLQKLSFDTVPTGGDGIVNFLDFAAFAENWQGDYDQLYAFASEWLQRGMFNADFAPMPTADGIVDIKDLAIFAGNWLIEL